MIKQFEEIVVSEKLPRITIVRPLMTEEERELKQNELNSEWSKIFWENERRKEKCKKS